MKERKPITLKWTKSAGLYSIEGDYRDGTPLLLEGDDEDNGFSVRVERIRGKGPSGRGPDYWLHICENPEEEDPFWIKITGLWINDLKPDGSFTLLTGTDGRRGVEVEVNRIDKPKKNGPGFVLNVCEANPRKIDPKFRNTEIQSLPFPFWGPEDTTDKETK